MCRPKIVFTELMLLLSVKLLLRFPTCTFSAQIFALSPLPSCPSEENLWMRELEGFVCCFFWTVPKSTAQKVLSGAFCYYRRSGWWFSSLNSTGVWNTRLLLWKELVGRNVYRTTVCVLTSPLVCAGEIEGTLSVLCSFSPKPNPKLTLLIARPASLQERCCVSVALGLAWVTRGLRGFLQQVGDSKFRFLIMKANEILYHEDSICTWCIYNG